MKIIKFNIVFFISLFAIISLSCRKEKLDDNNPVKETGHIVFSFKHYVDGLPLQKDTLKYINAAANLYEVDQIMYFVSDVKLHKSDGTTKLINATKDINFIDIDIPSTLTWNVFDSISVGVYDSISFTFGINAQKNISYMFVNPPEANMMWPDVLGGGYHYMMFNGKWKDTLNLIQNFNFHLGKGQLYINDIINVDSIYAFVPNDFNVKLPNSNFNIEKDKTLQIEIIMNIENWFKTPNVFDFNYWGGSIMQIQPAIQAAKENGADVFTIGSKTVLN